MPPAIHQEVDRLFQNVHYWPRGLYFASKSHKSFMAQLLQHAVPGGDCLDLGCGKTARYQSFIESQGMVWYGSDVIKELDSPHPNYVPSNDDRLHFSDSLFDVICTYNVIEHFRNPEAMFKEIARCLKQNGLLCGAVAFWEMEHDSYFHFTHKGLRTMLMRHGFELISMIPSEYSGFILASQRFFGGSGRIITSSLKMRFYSMVLGTLNWLPFLTACVLESIRRSLFRKLYDPLRDCATLYFFARKV